MKVFSSILISLFVSTTASAQILVPDEGSDSDISIGFPSYDLHGNNRAVAFGSVLLVADGYSVDDWQAVQAWDWCSEWPFPEPPIDDEEPFPGEGSSDEVGTSPCDIQWDVMVTTAYDLKVCPDGRAYIMRSGIGTMLEGRHTGHTYEWTEGVLCNEDLKVVYNREIATDKSRPIDRSKVQRVFK